MLPETIPPFGRLSFEKVLVKLAMHWGRAGDQEFRNALSLSRANRKEPNYFLFADYAGAKSASLRSSAQELEAVHVTQPRRRLAEKRFF